MNAQPFLESVMAGNVPTPPAATCAPVRGDMLPAQTAPDVSVRLFHTHTQTHMHAHVCSRDLTVLGRF